MSPSSPTVPPPKKHLKIVLFSDDQPGHMNAVIGMGQALLARGHRILFLLNEAKAGQLSKYGFEEVLLHNPNKDKTNLKSVAQTLLSSGNLTKGSPLDKLKGDNNPHANFMENNFKTLLGYNAQLEEVIQLEQPDLILFDHFMVPPAFPKSGIPFVYLHSGSPLHLYASDKLPPFGAGFPTASDPASWIEFAELKKKKFGEGFSKGQSKLDEACGYKAPDNGPKDFNPRKSPYLTIYGYPEELDYDDIAPKPEKCARVDAFCRTEVLTGGDFKLPEDFNRKPGDKLIYLSLGSMGSVDVDLMKRITSVLAKTPYKYIVSKGLRADEYELPPNCWGEAYLPQTRILPLVDLVITHGGNNTTVETLTFGKPMIVLPLFADQHDNAQRVTEKGYGARLDTYAFTDDEMIDAIERLLNDGAMKQRAVAASKRIQNSNSKELLCVQIEDLVADNFVVKQ